MFFDGAPFYKGGTVGQLLAKLSNKDEECQWVDQPVADFVDPTTATAEDIANALIAAGLMAPS